MYIIIKILLLFLVPSYANGSDLGTTGIIDTPSARMLSDGLIKTTISSQKIANIANITYQATPWLQTTFRYTVFNPENSVRESIPTVIDGLNDRSYSAKLTLKKETRLLPEIALGIRDLIGTGAWASEYIVSSKKINNLDVSVGIGWGRLSERATFTNPFVKLSDSFRFKGYSGGVYGGKIRLKDFFKGENIGVFGGIKYEIPNSNMTLLAEYNSDSYQREITYRTITDSSPLSYGIAWSPSDNLNMSLNYKHGNQIGVSISSLLDTSYKPREYRSETFFSTYDGYELSGAPDSLDLNSWYDSLYFDLERAGILLRKAKLNPEELSVDLEITNYRYTSPVHAIRKILSIGEIHFPSDINKINIIYNENNLKIMNIKIQRSAYKDDLIVPNNIRSVIFSESHDINEPTNYTVFEKLNTSINMNISSRFQLFDPDKPIKYQLYAKINTSTYLSEEWNLFGSFAIDIDNNFDQLRPPNSDLPHVRTDINKYLTEGDSGIESLYVENRSTIKQNLYYRGYFGILEQMYSGGGIEFLYMPFKSRIALGLTLNKLRKRGFKRNFELMDYETSTGFLSLYYASPFYNYDISLHIGRYLAKDEGATIEVRRTFDNGFSVGAFATITDVSASEFGEGSFDKGLFFNIPLDFFLERNTKSSYRTVIRSVQRDGGQRLDDYSGRLWHDLRSSRYDSFYNQKREILP